jgi:hypothetical protein
VDATIQNCVLALECRQRWQELEAVTGTSDVRFCRQCLQQVFFCRTDQELAQNVRLRRCVAFNREGPGEPVSYVGQSAPPYGVEPAH